MKLVNANQRVRTFCKSRPVKAISQQTGSETRVHGGNEVYGAGWIKMIGCLISPEIRIVAGVVGFKEPMNADRFRKREGRSVIAPYGQVIKHRRGRRTWHVIKGLVMELGSSISLQLINKSSTAGQCLNNVPGMNGVSRHRPMHEQNKDEPATGIRGQATSRGSGDRRMEVVVARITDVFGEKMRAWGSDIQATHSRKEAIGYNACCSGNTEGV